MKIYHKQSVSASDLKDDNIFQRFQSMHVTYLGELLAESEKNRIKRLYLD